MQLSITNHQLYERWLTLLRRRNSGDLPPSPPKLPIVGNFFQLGPLLHRSLASLSAKYGPVVLLHLGSVPVIVVSSAELAEEVMKTQDCTFSDRPPSSIASRLIYGSRDVAFASYGPYWRKMRKICVLRLLSIKRVQEFRSVREEEVALLLSNIRQRLSNSPVNLSEMLVNLTNDIICRVAMGRRYSSDEMKSCKTLQEAMALLGTLAVKDFIPWLGWMDELSGLNGRVRRTFGEFDSFLNRVLDDHIRCAKGDGGINGDQEQVDFVDILLALKEKDEFGIDFTLERESIKAIIWDMFAGATDTSSSTLKWAMANLIRNKPLMRKVQEEVRQVVGSNTKIKEEDIERMVHLKAVINETLRLYPPVPLLLRQSRQDSMLHGYHIPVGTRFFINAWSIARDPKYWEKPNDFKPERFLNNCVDFKGQDFQYIPFGAGRRGCPGMSFGLIIVYYTLANLLHYFDWDIPEVNKEEVLDLSETSGITVHKKYDLVLTAKTYKP
ncbi:Cytochrome P450 71A1 [Apostasia shenzhenica]|uniref:Cytochrome P450 71A1 n=1 Tax=Apostasia shenzhenica TaxID=1088818 RepID=A0A2I0AUC7_9ASPA|nr:Cytochrome P450 71A1 [Apostasia shenzhenica]